MNLAVSIRASAMVINVCGSSCEQAAVPSALAVNNNDFMEIKIFFIVRSSRIWQRWRLTLSSVSLRCSYGWFQHALQERGLMAAIDAITNRAGGRRLLQGDGSDSLA